MQSLSILLAALKVADAKLFSRAGSGPVGCTGDRRTLVDLIRWSVGSLCWLCGLLSYSDRLLPLSRKTWDAVMKAERDLTLESWSFLMVAAPPRTSPPGAATVWSSLSESVEEPVSVGSLRLSWLFLSLLVLTVSSTEPLLLGFGSLGCEGGRGWYGLISPSAFLAVILGA